MRSSPVQSAARRYEMHGHGLSIEKNGQRRADKTRGQIESSTVCGDHNVEMAKIMVAKHKLPLIITGHSQGAVGTILSTRRVVDVCKANDVPYVTGVYLSPIMEGAMSKCCTPCCCAPVAKCCCGICGCCGFLYVPMDGANKLGFNPGYILSDHASKDDRNQTHVNLYNWGFNVCMNSAAGGVPNWPRLLAEIDVGVPGRIFAGTEEVEAASWLKETEQKKLPSSFRVDILQGLTHDYLNADPNSMQAIGKIFDYIDAARGPDGRGGQAVVDAVPDMDRGGP